VKDICVDCTDFPEEAEPDQRNVARIDTYVVGE
jgi:hypothetical protein